MSEIRRILESGKSSRVDDIPIPTQRELDAIERDLGFRLPESYREFARLGGLAELRINHRVLSPSEILESMRYLPDPDHIPFADNGCGDFYCWPRDQTGEPTVLFADHETRTYSQDAESFVVWLQTNRF